MKIILCYRRVANLLLVIIMIIRSTFSPSKSFHTLMCALPNKAGFIGLGNLISRVAHSFTNSGSVEEGKVHVCLGKGD